MRPHTRCERGSAFPYQILAPVQKLQYWVTDAKLFIMNNAVNFKFSFETDNYEAIHQLMPLLMEKVRELQHSHSGYRTVELNIAKPAQGRKTACLTIHHPD